MARIMGVDAGFQALGVVVVEDRRVVFAGTCRTERTAKKRGVRVADDDAERCQQLSRFLIDVIQEQNPAGAIVELPSGGAQGARANRAMGMATGIVVSALEITKLPAEWVTPQMVKEAATGRKDGSKEAVQAAVERAFDWHGLWPKTKAVREHVADAAAAILAGENGTLFRALERVG